MVMGGRPVSAVRRVLGVLVVGAAAGLLGVVVVVNVGFVRHSMREASVGAPPPPPSPRRDLATLASHPTLSLRSARPPLPSAPPPTNQDPTQLINHVVFTTFAPPQSDLQRLVLANSLAAARALKDTALLVFVDDPSSLPASATTEPDKLKRVTIPAKNEHGMPILRDMYLAAWSLFPSAKTATFFNSDVMLPPSLPDTANALLELNATSHRFLGVGYRFNAVAAPDVRLNEPDRTRVVRTFETFLFAAKRAAATAEDFFIASKDLWDWSSFPPFVVGRTAYDNYLVSRALALHDQGVVVVDVSLTCPVVHQAIPHGHAGASVVNHELVDPRDDDHAYNSRLARSLEGASWDHRRGGVDQTTLLTTWSYTPNQAWASAEPRSESGPGPAHVIVRRRWVSPSSSSVSDVSPTVS